MFRNRENVAAGGCGPVTAAERNAASVQQYCTKPLASRQPHRPDPALRQRDREAYWAARRRFLLGQAHDYAGGARP